GSGVRVGVVVPGVVRTPFFERRGRPYQRTRPRPVAPQVVAAAIERMIRTGRAESYVPRWLAVPAGLPLAVPSRYRWLPPRFGGRYPHLRPPLVPRPAQARATRAGGGHPAPGHSTRAAGAGDSGRSADGCAARRRPPSGRRGCAASCARSPPAGRAPVL